MYYIYHIKGKKIGVTSNLLNRVTKQQGYALGEYEVLLSSDDIDYISEMEIELQKSYGYKVDRQKYKNLIKSNKMRINVTEQTTTFACPKDKLKGQLLDNKGFKWETSHGEFELTDKTIQWIIDNSVTSMYNDQRCYIYNKAFSVEFLDEGAFEENSNVYDLIRAWAKEKGIYDKGDSRTQYVKLMEEAGELAKALLKNDRPEIIDAIGDMVVVLTNLAKLENLLIEDCVVSAYDVIKSRKGKMIGGTFVKETL
jgi:NTP pyrophosphatase (non-canonical NTP hydrolase)